MTHIADKERSRVDNVQVVGEAAQIGILYWQINTKLNKTFISISVKLK